MKKETVKQAIPKKDGHKKALRSGAHGHIKNSDGTPHSTPNPHDNGGGALKVPNRPWPKVR